MPAKADCIGCHMPKRRSDDAVHVVMTDHYIRRNKPSRDLLAPFQEADFAKLDTYRGEVIPYDLPGEFRRTGSPALPRCRASAGFRGLGAWHASHATGPRRNPSARPEFYYELAEAYEKAGQT